MFSTKKQSDVFLNKLFANADKKEIKFKFSPNKLITFKEGDIVFKKGDKTNYVYLIMEGDVKLKIPNPPFAPKIQFKYKNDFFGEKEVLEKSERKTSCVAEKACQLYPITNNELQKLISSSTTVKDNLEMVTIASEGKTLKEITKESTRDKGTEEKIDYAKAIKTHPEKPITSTLKTEETKENEFTIENIFKTDEIEKKEDVFTDKIENVNPTIPEIGITKEEKPKTIKKPETKEEITEENKLTEETTPVEKTAGVIQELPSKEKTEEIEPEEKKISDEKYLQIINASHSLLMTSNVDVLTQEIVLQAKELVNAERCVIFFVNYEDKMLETKIKDEENQTTELKIPLNNSITGICSLRNKIAIINDVSTDDRFNPIYDEMFNFKTKDLLIIPISDGANVIAALELINSGEESFTEIDVDILKIFSKSILLSLSNCTNIKNLLTVKNNEAFTNVAKYIYDDIKNPILTIKHYAKILIKDKIPEEIKQILQLIIKQTDFVDSINANLSSFNEESVNLSLKVFSFKETIDDILSMLAEYSESRNIVLFKKIDVEAKVKLDPKNFMVACYQVIKNACDAQPNKGSVYITSTLVDGVINIEFKDSGEGVPVDTQEQIFSKFLSFKADKHIGIGLNIADKIIKEHKGKLTVSNSSEGGAIFTISLPVVK